MVKKGIILVLLFYSIGCSKRIHQDSLHRTSHNCIPHNLEDCLVQIDSILADSIEQVFRGLSEDEFISQTHFGLGLWMRNNWRLWGGSRLTKYFNKLEIYHPDDMSGIILISYHRKLNNKEIELNDQVKYYQGYWDNLKKQQ